MDYITFESFLAEFESANNKYYEMGLIDRLAIYQFFVNALKDFGATITQKEETVIPIQHSKGRLPENFYCFDKAFKCEVKGYSIPFGNREQVCNSRQYINRVTNQGGVWKELPVDNTQDCCFTEEIETSGEPFRFHYYKPQPLRLVKNIQRSPFLNGVRENYTTTHHAQVSISGETIYTEFKQGYIYLIFNGHLIDDSGKMVIPIIGNNLLQQYVNYYVLQKFFERLLFNKDDEHVVQLLQYVSQQAAVFYQKALSDVRQSNITPDLYRKLAMQDRQVSLRHEMNIPKL